MHLWLAAQCSPLARDVRTCISHSDSVKYGHSFTATCEREKKGSVRLLSPYKNPVSPLLSLHNLLSSMSLSLVSERRLHAFSFIFLSTPSTILRRNFESNIKYLNLLVRLFAIINFYLAMYPGDWNDFVQIFWPAFRSLRFSFQASDIWFRVAAFFRRWFDHVTCIRWDRTPMSPAVKPWRNVRLLRWADLGIV